MSKIVRYNGDVNAFASSSIGTERTIFGDVTQSDLLSDQLTADFLRGWGIVGASENPTLQDFSAAMFTATQFISYLHQMGIAEWNATQEYPTKGALVVHAGMVWRLDIQASASDEPGTSRAWIVASGEVSPLGNKNVYYRTSMVISPDPAITFPPTSGLTGDYAAGEEIVYGTFAGAAGVSDVVITDNLGITWGANSIELRYDIENTTLFTQGDETIYIVDESGARHWLKVADIAALTSTLTVNELAVDIDFAIFAELGITSMLEIGLQDVQGVFGEKDADEVFRSLPADVLIPFIDPLAIGANPNALRSPDGTVRGSTDNHRYIRYPNRLAFLFYSNVSFDTSTPVVSQYGTTSGTTYLGTDVWTYPIELTAVIDSGANGNDSAGIGAQLIAVGATNATVRNRTNVASIAADATAVVVGYY